MRVVRSHVRRGSERWCRTKAGSRRIFRPTKFRDGDVGPVMFVDSDYLIQGLR